MSRRRRRSQLHHAQRIHTGSSSGGILSKDPYGLIWLSLLLAIVFAAKWLILTPPMQGCVLCVVGINWFIYTLAGALLMFFWILWAERFPKNTLFIFTFNVVVILLILGAYKFAQYVIAKLFFGGMLSWLETEATYLFDVMLPHTLGLALLTVVTYSMVRVLFCSDLQDKRLSLTYGILMVLSMAPLFLLGLVAY